MSSGFFVVSLKSWLKFNDPSQHTKVIGFFAKLPIQDPQGK